MKIAFGMIVFEGDYVLKECLEQIYPHAEQILIAEGPVEYFQQLGKTTSEDKTNEILHSFPDPENKIKIIHGQFKEKDEQSNAYMSLIKDDIDYLWMIDSDEVYKTEDIILMKQVLEQYQPTSVGVKSCTFYGGFTHYLTGFEQKTDNFLRIFKYETGCDWITHRPPTINYKNIKEYRHIDSDALYESTGIQMYHYSYTFPEQVRKKIEYYKAKVSGDRCIDDYYNNVFKPWFEGDDNIKQQIEQKYLGVHEWKPEYRGECFTNKFTETHPASIIKNFNL